MRILVTGAGRGGSSLTREVVKGLNIVKWYPVIGEEDRSFFNYIDLPENYGTKLTTEEFYRGNITDMMKKYEDLHLIFSFRNPIDQCMSKIVRGQPRSKGGDGSEELAPDATVWGAIKAVKLGLNLGKEMHLKFPERVHFMDMESLILYPRSAVTSIAQFLKFNLKNIPSRADNFYKYNTNQYQIKRYGSKLDKSQIDIHKRWDTAYDGYFRKRKKDIDTIWEAFK